MRNAVWRNSWWLKLNETGLASGSKVAARVGDAHSAGSRNAATAIVVIGVLLALMLLVGVGYYVYKRWVFPVCCLALQASILAVFAVVMIQLCIFLFVDL